MNEEKQARIMVVDDDKSVRLSMARILSSLGHAVTTADSGARAVELFDQQDFDLVLTDLQMDNVGGMEVLSEAKKRWSDIIVIVITAYASLNSAIEALNKGAYNYLLKPHGTAQLQDAVRKGLEKQALQRHNQLLLRELQEKNARLEQLNQYYLDTLRFVGHEFGNALNIIGLGTELLQMRIADRLDEEEVNKMENILLTARRLGAMVKNYLSLSQLEEGKLKIYPEDLDLYRDVVKPVIEEQQTHIETARMKLVLDGMAEGHRARADANLMKIVYHNLLGNAIKYGDSEGIIKIGLRKIDDCNGHGAGYNLNVWNEGAGLTEEEKRQLFAKFVRLKSGIKEGKKGTGLGLFITQQIIEMHKGKIWVESQMGRWTNFIFSIPQNLDS